MKKNITENKNILLAGILAAVAAGSTACNDMTTAQFQDQQCQANANQLKAFNGVYTGQLMSSDGKTPMGVVSVNVDTVTQPTTTSDGTGTTCKAASVGSVSLIGGVTKEASFSTLSISPTDGSLSGVLVEADQNDSLNPQQFKLEGKISGGNFSGGKLSSLQNPNDSYIFSAKLGVSPSSVSSHLSSQGPQADSAAPIFVGNLSESICTSTQNGVVGGDGPCQVSMTISDAEASSAGGLFDALSSHKNVIVNVTMLGSIDAVSQSMGLFAVSYPQAFSGTLDLSSKSLSVTGTALTGGATIALSCHEVAVSGNSNGTYGWDCTRNSSGLTNTVHFVAYPAAQSLSN